MHVLCAGTEVGRRQPDTDRRGLQWLSGEYRSRDAYGGAIAETIKRRSDEDARINWQATRARPSIMLLILNFEDGWLALSGRGGSRRCWTLIDPPTNVPAVVCGIKLLLRDRPF